ncbi:MAG TPA: ABC transporter substrate-binding protein, partial [Acidimicrobiales bacterium]|nr:ABC transporter substrate-binding protein [Acidimicrobiales bacterium]
GTTGGTTGGATGGTTGGTTGGGVRPASGEPILLGAVGTKSGIVGAALEGGFRGLTVWERWVNANGGIQGRPVRVIQVDDAADPGKHASAIRRLIVEEHVVAFIGNIAPFTFSAGAPILEDAGVPAIGGEGADRAWFSSPLAFPINGQNIARSRPAAKWALANLSQRKAAVIFVSEADAPAQLAQHFVDEWRKGGGQVLMNSGVSLATPDFTGEVVQAKNSGADIMFVLLEKAACNRFMDAMRRQAYRPIIIAPACVLQNAVDHKDVMTGNLYAAHAAKPVLAGRSPAEDEVLAAVRRFDPRLPPDGAFMFGWLAGKLFEAAMGQSGTTLTPQGIVAALHRLPATGLGGLTPAQAWPPGPHAEGRCGMISRFNGERFVLLTPDFVC